MAKPSCQWVQQITTQALMAAWVWLKILVRKLEVEKASVLSDDHIASCGADLAIFRTGHPAQFVIARLCNVGAKN
jgi:hypothetical protein